jgi:alanyl-tRNA synthetase
MLSMVARQIGGKGGGRADMAQGGGGDPAGVPAALKSVNAWVAQQLQG